MGRGSYWNFYPIIGILFQTLRLTDCEMYAIWILGKEGPKAIKEIAKLSVDFPKPDLSRMFLPDENMKFRLKDIPPTYLTPDKKPKFKEVKIPITRPPNYSNSAIYYAVNRLREKKLVKTISREPLLIVELTFIGLMLYLQNSMEKTRFINLFKNHSILFPFASLWNNMVSEFGTDTSFSTLEKTIQNFHGLEVVNYFKKPEKLAIETFYYAYLDSDLRSISNQQRFMLNFLKDEPKVTTAKADKVWQFLKRDKAKLLRETYITFLAAQDIKTLDLDTEVPEDRIVELKSEKELANFEQREIMSNPLFKGGRLMELFPKYSGIEYYFTGMFINNLLWNKKIDEEKVN